MIDFFEFLARRPKAGLPDAQSMLTKAGIDPHGPHDVEVERLVRKWKKRPTSPANEPLGIADPAPRSGEKYVGGPAIKTVRPPVAG